MDMRKQIINVLLATILLVAFLQTASEALQLNNKPAQGSPSPQHWQLLVGPTGNIGVRYNLGSLHLKLWFDLRVSNHKNVNSADHITSKNSVEAIQSDINTK